MKDLTEKQKLEVKVWALEIYIESLKAESIEDAGAIYRKKVGEL